MLRNHTHKWSATILMAAILFVVSSCDGVTPGGIDPPVGGDSDLSSGTEDVIPGLLI